MSIKARVEDAMVLAAIGRLEAALLSLLTAISATSRKRWPRGTRSEYEPGKPMRDGEAFESFLRDEMPRICRVGTYTVKYRGEMHRLEHVLYRWFRCELAHEAALPLDIEFVPDDNPGMMFIRVNSSGLAFSHGWLNALANALIYVPENADQFGSPAKPPLPVQLPRAGLASGTAPQEATDKEQSRT